MMRSQKQMRLATMLAIVCLLASLRAPAFAQPQAVELRPAVTPSESVLTLTGAVHIAEKRYPQLLQAQSEAQAARANVKVQKIKEYVPRMSMMYQTVVGSHNRLTQTIFGNEVLPATPGPGPERVSLNGDIFGASGFLVDWAPLDFGLHAARIGSARAQADVAQARLAASLLDTQVEAATRYLDTLVMKEEIAVAEANLTRFRQFSTMVKAQVDSGLRAGADYSLAEAQVANARNDLIRARLDYEVTIAGLAKALGMAGEALDINPGGLIFITEPNAQEPRPIFAQHPLAREAHATVISNLADRRVLSKEGYPTLRWLGGMNFRGTSFLNNRGDVPVQGYSGVLPYIPNWNIGLMVDWRPTDLIRISAEKKVVDYRVAGARHAYDAVIQALQTQDVQSRARVRAAIDLAANMPIQVHAAELASRQAEARYEAGLATIAQVAEAIQILADSRVKLAVANVGVWRALLQQATVTGDITQFLAQADKATRETR